MKTLLSLALVFLVTEGAFALGQDRGGGDPCENQIKIIRDEIASWIQRGGPQGLRLPAQMNAAQYSKDMQGQISKAKIRCVGAGDQGFPVQVYRTPKVCEFEKGFMDKGTITCDRESFLKLSETDQYVLVHHEYAGLAGLENPNKEDSKYNISNQISDFLENVVVKRLAVKASRPEAGSGWRNLDGKEGADLARSLQEALKSTKFVDCDVSQVNTVDGLISCGEGSYYYRRFNFILKAAQGVGYTLIPVGNFDCGDEKKSNEYSKRYFMQSTSGAPSFLNILQDSSGVGSEEDAERTQINTIYELDPTETKIAKVTLSTSKFVRTNKGTISKPNWVTENVALPNTQVVCHAAR